MKPSRPGERWWLELQIHPSDIRKRVRYLFLSRPQITAWSLPALLYVAALAVAAAVAPGVVAGLMNRGELLALQTERGHQGERLQALVGQMGELDHRAAELDLRLEKVYLAYHLPPARAPRRAVTAAHVPVPDSIWAGAIEQGGRVRDRLRDRLWRVTDGLGELRTWEVDHPEQVRTTPSVCPLGNREFVLISSFGNRRSPFTRELELHAGADLAAPVGTPVNATADGVVAFAGQYPLARYPGWWRFGNLVVVENGDSFVTLYGHADQVLVRQGQRVRRGDRLATVGSSGWSTSPHLHYEIRHRGADGAYRPVDPLIYILDHRWPNDERLLIRARNARPVQGFEPLPPSIGQVSQSKTRRKPP
jgi:murein DD-endopeptidase MepM/ murein hydrolase activator NlpD